MATEIITKEISSVTPSSYDSSNYSYGSVNSSNPLSNPIGKDSSSTTYAEWDMKHGNGSETYVFYKFDLSEIPSDATINSVTCNAKGYISQTSSNRVSTRTMQMFYGTSTPKGDSVTLSNSESIQTLHCGTWTREELNDCRIRLYGKRGILGALTTTISMRFYGAGLTINYSYDGTEYTITTSTSEGGTIEPSGSIIVINHEEQNFTFSSNTGYDISNVLVDNKSLGVIDNYTFQNVTSNHTLHVDFSKKIYNINVVISGNGNVTYSKDSPFEYGDIITCTFNPDSGYAISKIIIDGNSISNISSYTFENISDNHTIEVTFKKLVKFEPNNTSDLINIYPDDNITIFSGDENFFLASTESDDVKEIKFKDEENTRYKMHELKSDIFKWGKHPIVDGFGKGIVSYRSDGKPPVLSTTKSKFGGKSLYFDNINNSPCMLKINTPTLHSETFTISFWVNFDEYYNSSSQGEKILELDNNIVIQPYNSSGTWYMAFWICNDVDNASYISIGNSNLSLNTWYNFTLCRNVDTYYFFINGNLCYSKSYSNMPKLTTLKLFGEESETLSYYSQQPTGYLDELMICDSCLYTSNYTVKSSEWKESELTGNYLVLHCNKELSVNTNSYNSSIIDKFTYNGNLYTYNDSTLFTNKKNIFINNSKTKGSFDIDLKENLDTFTIGFWYKKEADDGSNYSCLISIRDEINNKSISLYNPHVNWSSSNLVIVRYTGSYSGKVCNNTKFSVGEWHYITLCKKDSLFELYIDGVYDTYFTFDSTTINKIRFGTIGTGDINCSSSYGDIYISSEYLYNSSKTKTFPYPTQPFNTLYLYKWDSMESDANIDIYPLLKSVNPFYIKSNGVWTTPTAYIKQNGEWVLQEDLNAIFDENTKFAFKGHIT